MSVTTDLKDHTCSMMSLFALKKSLESTFHGHPDQKAALGRLFSVSFAALKQIVALFFLDYEWSMSRQMMVMATTRHSPSQDEIIFWMPSLLVRSQ